MPEISLFYGIRVTMYYDDHNPPHFHAEYNGNKAIEIDNASVIKGALPSRQLKLILAWCVLHQDELMQNWELSKHQNEYALGMLAFQGLFLFLTVEANKLAKYKHDPFVLYNKNVGCVKKIR